MAKKTIAELMLENLAWFTNNDNNEIQGLWHQAMNTDIIDSFVHKDELKTLWTHTIVDIRQLTGYSDKIDVGCFDNKIIYEFDETSTDADDSLNVLKPDDLTTAEAGRWVKQLRVAEFGKLIDDDGDTEIGVELTPDEDQTYSKAPSTSTIPLHKFINGNGDIVGELLGDGSILLYENAKIGTKNIARALLIQHNGSWWGVGKLYMKDNLIIDKNNYIGFAFGSSYPTATLRWANSSSGTSGIEQKTKHISVSGNDGFSQLSASGNFGINIPVIGDIKGIFQLRNTKLPTNLSNGKIISADGTNIITAINLYDEFKFDVKIGSIISIDSVNYTVIAVNSDTEIELDNTVPAGDYIYLIEDINNKISVTRYGYVKISDDAGEDSTRIAEERLDVENTLKTQGRREETDIKTANFTADKNIENIFIDAGANTVDVLLPEITANYKGQTYFIMCVNATNTASVTCSATDVFYDTGLSIRTMIADEKFTIFAFNGKWYIK